MPDNEPATTSPNTTTAEPPQTPPERLKKLQADLKDDEDKLSTLTKQRDALKSDVDALAKTVGEIETAKTNYGKGFPKLEEEKQRLDKYQGDMNTATESLLGPKKDKVVEKIKDVEKKITDQEKAVADAQTAVKTTGDKARAAQDDLDQKQKDYDDYKTLEKDIGNNLQTVNDFKKKVDQLNDVPKAASMYVYLREMKRILDKTSVPNAEDFEKELNRRWSLLDAAKETARTTKLAFDAAKTQLATAEATLAALKKSRVDDLIAATDEFNK
jgi:chromosome segregation ATPase